MSLNASSSYFLRGLKPEHLEFVDLSGLVGLLLTHSSLKPWLTNSLPGELSLLGKAAGRPENAEWLFLKLSGIPQGSVSMPSVRFWSEYLLETPPGLWVADLVVPAEDCADPMGVLSRKDDEPPFAITAACSHGHRHLVAWALKADFSALSHLPQADCAYGIGQGFVLAHTNGHEALAQLLRKYVTGDRESGFEVEPTRGFVLEACKTAVRIAVEHSTKHPSELKSLLKDSNILAAAGSLEFVHGLLAHDDDPPSLMWFLDLWAVPGFPTAAAAP